ncbi:MAG: cytochrome ubiquinol oxidase subunit I [Desulfurococcales archaeon]|nr:cytochrome ubiquinol oxidase subunit I [Desulfurococcales archaeon]
MESVFWLAFVFGFHIVLVNMGITLGILAPYLRWRSLKEDDKGLERVARELTRMLAATYALAGVFATAFTVFLLSFYPGFIGLAGNIAMSPFAIAILSIVLNFFTIAAFYYGWDRWAPSTHLSIGFFMALTFLLIPLGFRAVFAFLNTPQGLYFEDGVPRLDLMKALANPTLPPLYLKSIIGALTAGTFALASAYAYRYVKSSDEEMKRVSLLFVKKTVPYVLLGLIIMAFLGLWYAFSLQNVAYKFNNIFANLGWKVGDGIVHYDMSWLFIFKVILVAIQFVIIIGAYNAIRKGSLDAGISKWMLFGGGIALFTVLIGEYLNAFSQYPYFIADLTDPRVLAIVPKNLVPVLAQVLSLENVNQLATLRGVMMLTTGFMTFLIGSAIYYLYIILKPEVKSS